MQLSALPHHDHSWRFYAVNVICVIGANVVVTLRGYQLDIAVQLPDQLKNTGVRGLMGNFNDNATDDLINSDGVMIDANSTEERIHYDFGETC